jgi:phage-related protein
MSETREIKTTLAIDGEQQFKAAMDEAYRGMKVLGSEMKLNTAVFGDNASSLEGLTKKGEILGKQISQQKEIVAALSKAVEDSAAAYGESDKRTDAYRIKLNNATAALNKMEGELSDNEKAVKDFGKEVSETEKKTINWTAALSKVGEGVKSAAKATGVAMVAIGTGAVAAGKEIFNLATGTGKFADDIITMSAQTGISTQSLQEWTYAAQFIDTEVETMTGSMAKMIKQMSAAKEGTGASADAFAALGVGITDSSGKMLDSETVFFAAIDALGKVGNETERDALAMQLFGKSAQDLNPLILAGSDQLKALGQEAQNAGLIMSEQALGNFGAFDDTMNRITSTMTGIGRNVASVFLPAIQAAATGAQEMMTTINQSLADGFQPEDIETIGQEIASKLSDGMQKITEYLPQIITTVTSVLSELVNFAVDYLPKLMPLLMDAAVKLLQGAIKAITDNISKIAEMVTTLIRSLVKFIVDNLPAVIKVGIEIILALAKGLVAAIPDLIAALPEIISAIVKGLIGAIPQIISIGADMVKGLWEGIKSMAAWLGDKVGSWIGGVWKDIKRFFGIASPSKLMANTVGKPIAQGVAVGILNNAGLVTAAMGSLVPDTSGLMSALGNFDRISGPVSVTGKSSLTVSLDDSALDRLAAKLADVINLDGAAVVLNDREMGRWVRKVALA